MSSGLCRIGSPLKCARGRTLYRRQGGAWRQRRAPGPTRLPSNSLYKPAMAARTRNGAIAPAKKAVLPKKRPVAAGKFKSPGKPADKHQVRIFVSYSHKDAAALDKLRTHLAPLSRDGVSLWFDGDMDAGDAMDASIARELRRAQVFVALLSPDYLASRYCWDIEWRRAMNRRARGTMRIVAVVVKPCGWKRTNAARFKLLPHDGKAVIDWRSADHAYVNVVEGIAGVVRTIRKEKAAAPKPSRTPSKRKKVAKTAGPAASHRSKPAAKRPRPRKGKVALH